MTVVPPGNDGECEGEYGTEIGLNGEEGPRIEDDGDEED